MNGIHARCAATIGWVICLSQLDGRSQLLELGPPAYLLLCTALLILLVPALRRANTLWILAVAFPVYMALELLGGPLRAEAIGRSLLGFVGPAVAIALCSRVSRQLVLAEEAISELALGRPREAATAFAKAEGQMFREVRRARRYERPLSLLAVSARRAQPPPALARLRDEARRESTRRLVDLKVGALLDDATAGSAVIADRDGHFLVLLPEARRAEAEEVAKRLEEVATERHGIALHVGLASFPHQEITFDKLLETAETELRALERAPQGPAPAAGGPPRVAAPSAAEG